ncbi:MAG: metalloprotease [Roseibacillus sp.]
MFRVSKLRFTDSYGQIVAPEQVPEPVLARLKDQVEPLIGSGFEYLGMRQESRGDEDYWQAFLTSAGGMVWAVAEEPDEQDEGRRVKLISFGSNGSVAVTADGEGSFGVEWPGVLLRRDSFVSALEQAENHALLLTEEKVPVIAVEPEMFLNRYERMSSQGLDSIFQRGWLEETQGRSLKVPFTKLPQVAIAWIKYQLGERGRKKSGASWLLDSNLGEKPAVSQPAVEVDESGVSEDVLTAVAEQPVFGGVEVLDAVPEVAVIDEELEGAVAEALAANERALEGSQVESMPVGPIDGEMSTVVHQEKSSEEMVPDEPAIQIPEEDGLARDWALYQQQASKKSWVYWFGGFGGRAILFLSLLVFSLWMATSAGWGLRVVLFGVVALLVHEGGHAVAMLARRSWDWSQFLIPLPHAMRAKHWSIDGGFGEFLTILAGPLPGFILGWVVLAKAYFGSPISDAMLDFALAAIVVNGVTLLPFLPLDGGRLLDLAVLRRMPQMRVVGLVFAGLLFFGLVPFGGGVIAGVLGLLMWTGIPAARRRSKLLPWLRANVKEDHEQRVVTAFNISRERSLRKSFNREAGIARLDELIGLGQAKRLGFLGGLFALFVLFVSWAAPLALPAYSVVLNGQQWYAMQADVENEVAGYLGDLRPIKSAGSSSSELEAQEREGAVTELASWQKRLKKGSSQPGSVFDEKMELDAVRSMKWRVASHWIAEGPSERQAVAHAAVKALRREAIRSADTGDHMQSFRDLSVALRVIIECEPRHSLDSWVAWLELERDVLKEVEDVSSRYPLADTYIKWYEGALAQCPRPTSRKLAGLMLAESQGFESLAQGLDLRGISVGAAEGGVGRRFLSTLKGVGELVSVESLQDKREFSSGLAKSSSLKEATEKLKHSEVWSPELEKALRQIDSNYAFRQIAMSALKVKRVGMSGAARELTQLREDYGYTARLVDEAGERKSLKLSRLTPSGEVVEMKWRLQQ